MSVDDERRDQVGGRMNDDSTKLSATRRKFFANRELFVSYEMLARTLMSALCDAAIPKCHFWVGLRASETPL